MVCLVLSCLVWSLEASSLESLSGQGGDVGFYKPPFYCFSDWSHSQALPQAEGGVNSLLSPLLFMGWGVVVSATLANTTTKQQRI